MGRLIFILLFITSSLNAQFSMLFDNFDLKFPTDSLRAFYKMDGNANDASGNSNDGTVSGATLTTDRFGNSNRAYSFNSASTTDIIDVDDDNTLDLDNEITIACWFLIDTKQGSGFVHFPITKGRETSTATNYSLDINETNSPNGRIRFVFVDGGSNFVVYQTGEFIINVDTWYYIMCTHTFGSGSGTKIYFNNSEVSGSWTTGTGNEAAVINTQKLRLGNTNSGFYLDGKEDVVSIHSKVVTTEERTKMYNYPRSYP